jgi:phage shock protein PspC (stress-responsive transcriptional regulator)/predicted membrane protein
VAGGIARRLDIPAWVVRVAFVALAFGGGLGIALYVAGWLLIPEDDSDEPIAAGLFGRIQDSSGWVGLLFVGIGVLIVASSIDFLRGDLAVAVFLGVVGVMLYRGDLGRKEDTTPATAGEPPSTTRASLTDEAAPPAAPPPAPPVAIEPPKAPKPPREPSILGRLAVALVFIGTGVMAFFDYAVSTFDPTPRHYLGLAMGIIGMALLVGSILGRARGLIFVGILLTPALLLSPLAEFQLNSGVGERRVRVESVDQIAPKYDLAIGSLIVDLRDVDFSGSTVELETSVGIGSLQVLVPEGVAVRADAEVGIGEVQVFGSVRSGFARDLNVTREGSGTLILDAQTLLGEVRVTGGAGFVEIASTLHEVVVTPAQLQDSYEMTNGDIRLDMSALTLRTPRTVTVTNGLGTIHVVVPSRETTTVRARSGLGQIVLYGHTYGGFDTQVTTEASGEALLTLDIDIDSGEIVVEERS